jgi:hypothetical protein
MKLTLILFISLIFTGFIMQNNQQQHYLSKGEQIVNSILSSTAKTIHNKYSLIPCGEGAAMPGGPIQELTLCFDTKHTHTKEQLRKLLINITKELVEKVNENKEIQEFLKEPPFTIKNVEIVIYNHDQNGRSVCDPDVSVAEISQTKLIYRSIDPQDSFKYKNRFEESYEEALKLIRIDV